MKERQSNIELLRIFSILGVILLHYNSPYGGAAFVSVQTDSVNQFVLYVLQSLAVCAVDLFMLISGYFLCENNRRDSGKICELFVQVIAFSLAIYLLNMLLGRDFFSVKGLLLHIVPNNYFVVLYSVVFLLSPFINVLLNSLGEEKRSLLLLSILLFSVYPTCVDVFSELTGSEWTGLSSIGMYGSQWGYSAVNFVLLYLVGAYIRKDSIRLKKYSTKFLCGMVVLCVAVITGWSYVNDFVGYRVEKSAYEYCNPIIILEAVVLFLLFERIPIKNSKVINRLAKGVFTVFLLNHFSSPI